MNPKQPNNPKQPDQPPKLIPRDIGNGVFYDAMELPLWISDTDKKYYYFRWSHERKLQMLTKLGYVQVIDPATKLGHRQGTKDSEYDLVLVKQDKRHHAKDLEMKKARVDGAVDAKKVELPEGFTPYQPED